MSINLLIKRGGAPGRVLRVSLYRIYEALYVCIKAKLGDLSDLVK